MSEPPELDLAGLDRDGWIDLAIDRDDLPALLFGVLYKEEPFRQAPHNWKVVFQAIDNDATRHPSQHLPGDEPMGMRMIPEQTGTLTPMRWNLHFVFEFLAGMNMDEDVIATPFRRNPHPMKM